MKQHTSAFVYPHWVKNLGWVVILLAIGFFFYRLLRFQVLDFAGASFPLSMGLILLFFSREKEFDERIAYLKFRALAAAVPVTAVVVSLINYSRNFASYSVTTDSWYSISAFEFLGIALIIAISRFHYLRYNH